VHLLAPALELTFDSVNVQGGIGEASGGAPPMGTTFPRTSGGSGGSMAGAGGGGGGWRDNDTFYGAEDGAPGYRLLTQIDPTNLF
jgi:hypothetical protein